MICKILLTFGCWDIICTIEPEKKGITKIVQVYQKKEENTYVEKSCFFDKEKKLSPYIGT